MENARVPYQSGPGKQGKYRFIAAQGAWFRCGGRQRDRIARGDARTAQTASIGPATPKTKKAPPKPRLFKGFEWWA
jgi:hypothetical protein